MRDAVIVISTRTPIGDFTMSLRVPAFNAKRED
jgi:hypothetical protein